jgi:arylsulfatase A
MTVRHQNPNNELSRRTFLTAAASSLAAAVLAPAARAQQPPNIVFILIDDMGWADVGCNGSTFHETPHIDRLAQSGMRFTNGYAACPVCSPTRASIMTGKYPARLKLTDWLKGKRQPEASPILHAEYLDELPLEEVTIAEALKTKGYTTAHVGKWHLGGEGFLPENQGFDINIGGNQFGAPGSFFWPEWAERTPVEGEFDGQYLTDFLSEAACDFIETHQDEPFFLHLSHYSVHTPLMGKEHLVEKYEKKLETGPPPVGAQDNPIYAAMVESVDDSVGRVLDTLTRCGLDDNTIVVFFSDNGGLSVIEGRHTPATTNSPLRAGKGYLYEGGVREPCIVRWPGVTDAGAVSDTPVCSIDFFPTFCAAAGISADAQPDNMDGVDISPVLRDAGAKLDRDALYWHYPHFSNQGGRPGGAIRKGKWKLIERYEDGTLELYDLERDPSEQSNKAYVNPEIARELQAQLAAWRESVDANMPRPNPAVQ